MAHILKYPTPSGGININKLLSELTVALNNETPGWGWCNPEQTVLELVVPQWVDVSLVNAVVRRHAPDEQYTTGAIRFGAGSGALTSDGLQTDRATSLQPPQDTEGAKAMDIRLGEGDPYDDGNPFTGGWLVYPAREYPVGSGNFYNILGINANVLMFGSSAADGKLYAAGGGSIIDDQALSLLRSIELRLQTDTSFYGINNGYLHERYETTFANGANPGLFMDIYPEPGSNLVLNPDFETGDFTNWTTSAGTPANVSFSVDTETVHGGTYAAKVEFSGSSTNNTITSDDFSVTPGDVIEIAAWVQKNQSSSSRAYITITFDAGGQYTTSAPEVLSAWIRCRASFQVPTLASTAHIALIIATPVAGDIYYFDDVSAAETTNGAKISLTTYGLALEHAGVNRDIWIGYNRVHAGDEAGFSTYTNDAAQTTFYTRTIKGGDLGAYGVIRFTAIIQIDNGTAGGRTTDIKIKLGATTFVTLTTASIGAGNSRRVTIIGAITNQADAAVQELSGTWIDGTTSGQLSGTAAINTASDTTLTLTNTLSSAGALTFKRQSVIVDGPHYHAS